MKQALRRRHSQQCANFTAAPRLSEYSYIGGIAAKCTDIISYPFQGSNEVQHAHIARLRVLCTTYSSQVEIPKQIEAVIYRHSHNIVARR